MKKKRSGVRSQESGEGGFSLIEIIVTMVVLSIAMVGVLSLFTTSIRESADPLITSQAIALAQGEMDQAIGEKLLPSGFASITPGCKTTMPSAAFTCSRTITVINVNTKQVTVTISQPTIGSVTLDTYITNY